MLPENLKFGSRVNFSFGLYRKFQSKGRLLFRCGILVSCLWLCGYTLMTSSRWTLVDEIRRKGMTAPSLQEDELSCCDENRLVDMDDGITAEAAEYIKQLGLTRPGENGAPVLMPPNLSADIRSRIREGYDTHGYNAFVSSLVSLNRKIPDVRSEVCKNLSYAPVSEMPKCSVLISFHNEEWTLLIRLIHSVLNNSPAELIEEILLVDDASDRGESVIDSDIKSSWKWIF